MQYLTLLRPKQWLKNFFVFFPIIFSHELYDFDKVLLVCITFAAFCLASSSVYIVNDIADREKDIHHHEKKSRPIASGAISLTKAWGIAGLLIILAGAIVFKTASAALPFLFAYWIIHLLYSFGLKYAAILDVMIIASGFVLRVIAGASAIAVPYSHWILVITFFISLFLGFGKRRQELKQTSGFLHRPTLRHYNEGALDAFMVVSAALTLTTYTLYSIDPDVVRKLHTDKLIYTIPFVIYGLFRYVHLTQSNAHDGDAAEVLTRDFPLMIACVAWAVTVIMLIYFSV